MASTSRLNRARSSRCSVLMAPVRPPQSKSSRASATAIQARFVSSTSTLPPRAVRANNGATASASFCNPPAMPAISLSLNLSRTLQRTTRTQKILVKLLNLWGSQINPMRSVAPFQVGSDVASMLHLESSETLNFSFSMNPQLALIPKLVAPSGS